MADEKVDVAQLRAELDEAKGRIADLERRADFLDGQFKTYGKTIEGVMAKAEEVGAGQQQVTAAKTAFDKLAMRMDEVETKVEAASAKAA